MKIEYSWNDGVDFGDRIEVGDCFLYKGRAFVRVVTIAAINDFDENVEYNAIDLSTGDWFGILDHERVVPVDAKIVIDP